MIPVPRTLLAICLSLSVTPSLHAGEMEDNPQSAVQKLSPQSAWQQGYRGQGTTVMVLDSGVYADHPYFAGRMTEGQNTTSCNTSAYQDFHGHGTHVTGIIASVATETKVVTLRVLDKDRKDTASNCDPENPNRYVNSVSAGFDAAIDYATTHPNERVIINASLGRQLPVANEQELNNTSLCIKAQSAINAGITVVAAAMNNSTNTYHAPAACDGVIGVANTADTGALYSTSNFGSWIDIAAPGEAVLSTQLSSNAPGITPAHCTPSRICGAEAYITETGTSMSAAMVSAAAALLISINPEAVTPSTLNTLLLTGAQPVPTHGFNRINLPDAIAAVPRRPLPPSAPSHVTVE